MKKLTWRDIKPGMRVKRVGATQFIEPSGFLVEEDKIYTCSKIDIIKDDIYLVGGIKSYSLRRFEPLEESIKSHLPEYL